MSGAPSSVGSRSRTSGATDRIASKYAEHAPDYDRRTAAGEPYRRLAVDALRLGSSDTVVDVGCGTGLNFAAIQQAIGPEGQLFGVDVCPEMLTLAADRVADARWNNVSLIEASADTVKLPAKVDGALFSLTHDVMQSPPALENVVGQLKGGGRVVALGAKWTPWWMPWALPVNLITSYLNAPYINTFDGFDRPWRHLARLVSDLRVTEVCSGACYLASSTV